MLPVLGKSKRGVRGQFDAAGNLIKRSVVMLLLPFLQVFEILV